MASLVDLYARPGEGAQLTLWRTGITNADTVVTLTVDPTLTGAEATAFTDASGDDQGRVDITIPTDATEGQYTWTAEIDSAVVWTGHVYIQGHPRQTSVLAHSPDIRSDTSPAWVIWRDIDVDGGTFDTGPATQVIETGGPTTLDFDAIDDGEYLQRVGTDIVGATPAGTGDVTAAANFGTDNRLVRSDGTTKGVQASTVTLSDVGVMSGLSKLSTTDLDATGSITGISAADVGADASGTAASAVTTHEGKADPHTVYQLRSEQGDPLGYPTLDADGFVEEPALSVTDGLSTFTFGALATTEVLYLDGTTIKSKAGGGGATKFVDLTDVPSTFTGAAGKYPIVNGTEDALEFVDITAADVGADPVGTAATAVAALTLDTFVTGTAAASQVPRRNAGDTDFEWATLGASDVGADASGTATAAIATHVGLSDPHTQYQRESERGAASGYASLDSNTRVVEPAQVLRVTGQDLTAGAVTDGQYFVRSGTTYAGVTPDLDTWVPGTATASQVPRRNSGDSAFEWASLTAADVSAIATSAKGAASGVASLDSNTRLVEAAQVIRVTGQDLTVGAVSDGQMVVRSGTTLIGATAATATRQVAVLASDFSTSGSGASVTGWTSLFTITAGKTYRIEMGGAHQAASNSVSIAQFAIDWSQTPQLVQTFFTPAHTGGSTAYSEVSVNADNTYANSGAVVSGGANTSFWIGMIGVFKAHASTGGTITVNMRSNDGTTQVTLKAGAFISIDQLD